MKYWLTLNFDSFRNQHTDEWTHERTDGDAEWIRAGWTQCQIGPLSLSQPQNNQFASLKCTGVLASPTDWYAHNVYAADASAFVVIAGRCFWDACASLQTSPVYYYECHMQLARVRDSVSISYRHLCTNVGQLECQPTLLMNTEYTSFITVCKYRAAIITREHVTKMSMFVFVFRPQNIIEPNEPVVLFVCRCRL